MIDVKWCPELAVFVFKFRNGQRQIRTMREIDDQPMSDQSRHIMEQLMHFCQTHANRWVSYSPTGK